MIRSRLFILGIILLVGFILRLYRFDNPPADWHAFRQSDTNAVTERFVDEGINLLYPKYYDISNVQSGLDNPNGFRFVEFPIYNAIQALLASFIGVISVSEWGRLLTIVSSLATGIFVYLLTKKYAGEIAGIFAFAIYMFLPYSIFYGRVILPDPSMTAAITGGIYFFARWISLNIKHKKKDIKGRILSKKTIFFILSVLLVSFAFLLKPFAIFFILPMLYLAIRRFGIGMMVKWQLYLFGILALAPFLIWRFWIGQFPEGIPASNWLFNGNGIRFRPAFFRWIFYERITNLILGYFGVLFVLLGSFVVFLNKKIFFFWTFAAASLLYVFVIATGNVQHDYYQIPIIPTIAMFGGIGAAWLYEKMKTKTNNLIAIFVCSVIFASSFYFSWQQVRDYFNVNDWGMVAAGQKADEILPHDAIIIAPYDGSTTLLNMSKRPGWPVFQLSIEELIDRGATHMVIANPTVDDLNGFGLTYERIAESREYLILKLQ